MAETMHAPGDQNQVDSRVTNQGSTNPYETNPEVLPNDDLFLARSVSYGRYAPRDTDFKPRYNHWCEPDPEVTSYWENIVKELCTAENSLNVSGNREVFAAGSVVIRVDREPAIGAAAEKYSCANANELSAARKAEDTLKEMSIAVPVIYFCGTIDGKNVTVESRIPGVTLEVAWRYLTAEQIDTFKQQCRRISQRLGGIDVPPDRPSYVCSGLNSQASPDALEPEKNILFRERKEDEYLCLVHNNLVPSNIVVSDDKVIGITGWRQSGYFGFERADDIHRRFRILVASAIHGDKSTDLRAWSDLYEGLDAAGVDRSASKQDTPIPLVKTEPLNTNLDKVPLNEESEFKPPLSLLDGPTADHLTPKNIASLKNRGSSRASSSDRSSPATSTKPGPARKSATAATKKGTGRKSTTKKRKANELDSDNVDGGSSNTPSSARAGKSANKKRNSTSHTNSPAPDSKRKGSKNVEQDEIEEEEEDDSEDNDEIFCICRKPDNHTWMIGCDGGCEDWFHGKCVNIDPRDADLIDKYICPNCKEQGKGWTTWKPMCRLKECRKPARVNQKIPSKYCSDEHGREFMLQRTKLLLGTGLKAKTAASRATTNGINSSESNSRDGTATPDRRDPDDLGSRGGVLTAGDLKAVVMGVGSAREFRKLGESIISVPAEEENTTTTDPEAETKNGKKIGLDFDVDWLTYTPDEAAKLQKIRKQRDDLLHRKEMLRARNTFMTLVRQRSKSILEHLKQTDPKGGWKDICGFDSRLAWSDEEFDEWRLSEIGAKALEDGSPEALASSYPDAATDADGDTAMDDNNEDDFETLSRGVCTKKRCERHKQWLKVQQQDAVFEENTLALDLSKCEKEAKNVVERAVLRMWAESDNAQIGGQ
ncbi:hypothetical protein AbraIFM66951_009542 [Aspergillus brasiliensis]|uniref:PHD-type domain-containing protein n=1 Tax=Aspergillus brasiliensis TaxID=319629 RepID=A0A9W5YIQ6_9EURO|nr:hypothetical protein AbraCBS73388_002333 [Aspergillus brasiliensis]GKZ41432.1 hypothetical protein AbraIFM66951_009542 [Aspergillus brasiliensis]